MPMLDDVTQDEDCGAPIGKGLSSLWLCAGPEQMAKVIDTEKSASLPDVAREANIE
jgi:hypothetical protein